MDGVIVSNHGGRQVDRAMGSLTALPGVVAAVDGRAPVLFDSGIRTGADAALALALGADAVLLGRPYVYGLALDGEAGVRHVLRCVLAELDTTLALAGYASSPSSRAAPVAADSTSHPVDGVRSDRRGAKWRAGPPRGPCGPRRRPGPCCAASRRPWCG